MANFMRRFGLRRAVRLLARICCLVSAGAAAFAVCAPQAMAQSIVPVPLAGWDGRQATVLATNLDIDPRPELILLASESSGGASAFRYVIGWNLGADGTAQNWDTNPITVSGVGAELRGMGAALANINQDSRPELVLMGLVFENGQYSVRYKIGWDLDKQGRAATWGTGFTTAFETAVPATALDVLATNLDDDGCAYDYSCTDLIVILYDTSAAEHILRYKVGWNLRTDGQPQRWDTDFIEVRGIGSFARGARAKLLNLDDDPRPEMIVIFTDPSSGAFNYAIGWNLGSDGRAQRWERSNRVIAGVGADGYVAGIAINNLNADPKPDLVVMAYDAAATARTFKYQIVPDFGIPPTINLEMNKFASVSWPPASINRNGTVVTLSSIYARVGITVNVRQNDGGLDDPRNGECYSLADLHGLLTAVRDKYPDQGTPAQNAWPTRVLFVTCFWRPGTYGVMFDSHERRAFAMFMNVISGESRVMRTLAHELGHSLCLYHEDGDAELQSSGLPMPGTGFSIMNQTKVLAAQWGFGWNAAEMHKIYDRSMRRWRPGSGYAFETCH